MVTNLNILLITETEIGSSFSEALYEIDGLTAPYKDCHGGGMLLYIRQDILSTLLINLKTSENFCRTKFSSNK